MPPRHRLFVPTSILLNVLFITLFFVPRVPPQPPAESSAPTDNTEPPTSWTTEMTVPPTSSSSPTPVRGVLWPGRGSEAYRVLYGLVPASEPPSPAGQFGLTFATHGTPQFLFPHVARVAERWQGPVAVAVYAPGSDAASALLAISALRDCHEDAEDVRRFVTFHIFFEEDHAPTEDLQLPLFPNCSEVEAQLSSRDSYRQRHTLTYPVNAARNIARVSAQTQYVLVADLELYPSVGIVEAFGRFISRHPPPKSPPRVYVLPVFEVQQNATPPRNKTQLVAMKANDEAITFHKHVCVVCHKIPSEESWINLTSANRSELDVFLVTRREKYWEPIFIGTNREPLYDERLSWEGMSDKMAQVYEMCLMGYELHILDNAFLVHAPGIKKATDGDKKWRTSFVTKQTILKKQILKEIHARHTPSKNCTF